MTESSSVANIRFLDELVLFLDASRQNFRESVIEFNDPRLYKTSPFPYLLAAVETGVFMSGVLGMVAFEQARHLYWHLANKPHKIGVVEGEASASYGRAGIYELLE